MSLKGSRESCGLRQCSRLWQEKEKGGGRIIANGIIEFKDGKAMSAELIGILSVGVALGGLILWMGGWLRYVDRRLARLEGMLEASGLFRPKQSGTSGD